MRAYVKQVAVIAVVSFVLFQTDTHAKAANVTWAAGGSGVWDTTTTNWSGDFTTYTEGDNVTFADTTGGTITLTGNRAPSVTNVTAASGTYIFTGSNITSGNIVTSGGNTIRIDNQYTTNGHLSIGAGTTLRLGASNRLHDSSRINGGGTLDMNGFDETMAFQSGGAVHITNMGNLTLTHTGTVDRSGVGIMSGPGSLNFAPTHGITIIRDTHTYLGDTTINGGKVSMYNGAGNQLPVTNLYLNGTGTFDLSWHNASGNVRTFQSVNGDGFVTTSHSNNAGTNNTLRVGSGDASGDFSGVFSGGGSLVKIGNGTQILSGSNSYTGTTTVSDGTLLVNGTTAGPGQDDYTVQSGGTLGGSGTINLASGKAVTIESGGTLSPGNSAGTLTINGGLTLEDGSILNMELGSTDDMIIVNGQLTGSSSAGGITLNLIELPGGPGSAVLLDWSGGSSSGLELSDFNVTNLLGGELSIENNQLIFTAGIPEPASLTLLCLGLVGLRRRRRR